jgi:hypothetical protein
MSKNLWIKVNLENTRYNIGKKEKIKLELQNNE